MGSDETTAATERLPYDPERALVELAEYERGGYEQEAIADALRDYADERDRRAADLRANGWKLRQRLIHDGVLIEPEEDPDAEPF